jgi:predicted transcriptional regulator
MQLAGDRSSMVPLSPDERDAIDQSKAAAARGEFASEDEVRRVWAKHDR